MVRAFLPMLLGSLGLVFVVACIPGLSTGDDTTAAATTTTDASVADASLLGGGCGTEANTGIQLCEATTMCPSVVVDTTAMPNCGFRLLNGWADIVCACGTSICSMGVFNTCTQAAALLASQTEATVCTQVGDGRCLDLSSAAAAATATAATATTATSTSSTASSGGTGCDSQCVKDCGGGAACASVCNCQ